MTESEIKEYQARIEPWVPNGDVTMKDVVVHGLIPTCVEAANKAIDKVINEE